MCGINTSKSCIEVRCNTNVNVGITTDAFIGTAFVDNANLNVGIVTYAFLSTSFVDEQNVNLGLATDYTFQTSRNILGLTDVGITTTQFTNVEYVDTANINLGISTLARMFDALADNINIDVGSTNIRRTNKRTRCNRNV